MTPDLALLDAVDRDDLAMAVARLENPSLAARLTNIIGGPIERAYKMLPEGVSSRLNEITQASLEKALDAAVFTLGKNASSPPSLSTHKLLAGLSGAVGGAFGLPALAIELPISTTIMLRSVADIARSEGEKLDQAETRLSCLEVFALGSRAPSDDGAETGYFAVRMALAASVSEAAAFLAERAALDVAGPAMVQFIHAVSRRFNSAVTQKFAAQMVPAIGSVGGATVNLLFLDHFQDTARGHFVVRRLERKYGAEPVRMAYDALRDPHKQTPAASLHDKSAYSGAAR